MSSMIASCAYKENIQALWVGRKYFFVETLNWGLSRHRRERTSEGEENRLAIVFDGILMNRRISLREQFASPRKS